MSDPPDVAALVTQIENYTAEQNPADSPCPRCHDLLRSCLAALEGQMALLAGERYAAALRLEQYWETIGQPRPGRDDAQDWEDLVDALAALKGQTWRYVCEDCHMPDEIPFEGLSPIALAREAIAVEEALLPRRGRGAAVMPYTYRVETLCAATIREVWTVQSPRPLTYDELSAALDARGPNVTPVEDETQVTEAARLVQKVRQLP
jgi:hypothetical protein